MKKYIAAIASLCLLLTVACSSRQDQIEKAAKGYLQAMGDYQMDDAIPFATNYTRENTIPTLKSMLAQADTVYVNQNRPAEITIKKTEMLSDTSATVYYHKHTPIKEADGTVTVLLEDGQWLVDVKLGPIHDLNDADSIKGIPPAVLRRLK